MKAVAAIFDMVPGWVWAIFLAMAISVGCTEKLRLLDAKATAAEFKQQVAEKEAQRAVTAAQAEHLRAEVTAFRAQRAQEIHDEVYQEHRRTELAFAAGHVEHDRLQHDTETITAPSGSAGGGDTAALRRVEATARALGGLLSTCDAVAEGLGRDSEDLATQVRGLIKVHESLSVRVGLRATTLDPFPDRDEIYPSTRFRWDSVMDPVQPDPAGDTGVYLGLRLLRVATQVLGQRDPPTHKPLSDPR